MDKIVGQRMGQRAIGFGVQGQTPKNNPANALSRVEPEDLIQFGMIPELIGRLPVLSVLHPLSNAALLDILVKPRNALIRQYQKLFEMDGIHLQFQEDALLKVAELAQAKAMGARGLRAVLEKAMFEIMYELPSRTDVKECIVTREFIEAKGPPSLVFKKKRA